MLCVSRARLDAAPEWRGVTDRPVCEPRHDLDRFAVAVDNSADVERCQIRNNVGEDGHVGENKTRADAGRETR